MSSMFNHTQAHGHGKASESNVGVLDGSIKDILEDMARLNTDEAKNAYVHRWLERMAYALNDTWPAYYWMLARIRDQELYRNVTVMGKRTGESYASFDEYLEKKVKMPWETWTNLEQTYHFATRWMPELLGETFDKASDIVRLNRFDQQQQEENPHGGDRRSDGFKSDIVRLENQQELGYGNARQYALRKLRKDAPDLHTRVLAGEISPNAAMIEAGFRQKTITVPLDPERAAQTLMRHFTQDECTVIGRRLIGEIL